MDILSHGLWGGIAFGRNSRRAFWAAFAIGVLPDLLSFGPHFAGSLWETIEGAPFQPAHPRYGYANIPSYVFLAYNLTHSLVVFAAAFALVWLVMRRPYWPMAAWGLHVLIDIPTHNLQFFPTPFLWPISDVAVNGIPWSRPVVLVPNVVLLVLLYAWHFARKRRSLRT